MREDESGSTSGPPRAPPETTSVEDEMKPPAVEGGAPLLEKGPGARARGVLDGERDVDVVLLLIKRGVRAAELGRAAGVDAADDDADLNCCCSAAAR